MSNHDERTPDPTTPVSAALQLADFVLDYAIVRLGPDGAVQSWNEGAQLLYGYEPAEIVGRPGRTLWPQDDHAACAQALADAEREGRSVREGYRLRKDGARFWASCSLTTLRVAGELLGFVEVTRDRDGQRAAEEALRESEQRLRLLVESATEVAIFMLDSTGHVASWNSGAMRIKGYRPDEIIGRHFSTFYPPEQVQAGVCEHALSVARRFGRFTDQNERVRKDGSRFWADVLICPIRDDAGNLRGFTKVTRDLSERRAAEQVAQRLQIEQAINREKDAFLGTLSHELRTPMNSVLLWTEVLRQRTSEPSVLEAAAAIERNARAEVRLVDDLMDVSLMMTGRLAIERARGDLSALVHEAIAGITGAAANKKLSVHQDLEPGVFGFVDALRIRQALDQLLANAVKFSRRGGEISVTLRTEAEQAVVTVRDAGVGIEPAFLPRLFDRMRQADGSDTRRFGGLGIGLAIARGLVDLHGGELRADSAGVDQGATFTLRLPLASADAASSLAT